MSGRDRKLREARIEFWNLLGFIILMIFLAGMLIFFLASFITYK